MSEWLNRYTAVKSSHDLRSTRVAVGDRVMVTDTARVLTLAAKTAPVDVRPLSAIDPLNDKARAIIEAIARETPPDDAAVSTLGDLWDWLDEVRRIKCWRCLGRGTADRKARTSRSWPCEMCDGDGWAFPEPEPRDADTVVIAGLPVDRNMLAWWLGGELGEPDDPIRIWRSGVAATPAVAFAGELWSLHVSGFAGDSPSVVRGKSYRTYVPGAGLWWMCRRGAEPAVHPGTDWFMERGVTDLVQMWGEPAKEMARA